MAYLESLKFLKPILSSTFFFSQGFSKSEIFWPLFLQSNLYMRPLDQFMDRVFYTHPWHRWHVWPQHWCLTQDSDMANWRCIPSRELTYPTDKAYLKMIFLFHPFPQVGYVNFLEGIFSEPLFRPMKNWWKGRDFFHLTRPNSRSPFPRPSWWKMFMWTFLCFVLDKPGIHYQIIK